MGTIGVQDSQLQLQNLWEPSLNGLIGSSFPPYAAISTVTVGPQLLMGVNVNYGGEEVSDWWLELVSISTAPTTFEMGIYQGGAQVAATGNIANLITGAPKGVEIPLAFQGGPGPISVVFLIPDVSDPGSFSLSSTAGGGTTNNMGPFHSTVGLNAPTTPGFQASGVSALPADLTTAGLTYSGLNQILVGWS